MTIHYLPLEPLAQRYTAQMYDRVVYALQETGRNYSVIEGGKSYETIRHGEWLDTVGTCHWRLAQLQATLSQLGSTILEGDTLLLGDVWFPGIEAIKQVAELRGMTLNIAGWHYAGCFDTHDLLSKRLSSWGPKWEQALVEGILDGIAFGSSYHQAFVNRHCCLPYVSGAYGLVWFHDALTPHRTNERADRTSVVFNHRWASEKRWQEFRYLSLAHQDKADFYYSTNGEVPRMVAEQCVTAGIQIKKHTSKERYYDWLARQHVVWSGADQETFGYAFMEAIALGLQVVAPNRVAYPCHFERLDIDPAAYLYGADDPCGERMLVQAITDGIPIIPEEVASQYHDSVDRFLDDVLMWEDIG